MNKRLFWVFALSSCIYFTQGIEGLPSQAMFYYFKEGLNFSPEKIMLLGSITTLAWLVKPAIGYIIDNFFSKKIWIFISVILDIILVIVLGLFSFPIAFLVGMLIFNSTNAAFRDVSVDGIMCVEGKRYNATGKIQSIQWIAISLSGLITGIGGGYIAHKWNYQAGFLFLIPFYLVIALVAHLYREDTGVLQKEQSSMLLDFKRLFSDKKLLVVALFIFLYKYSPSFGTPLLFIQRDQFRWSKTFIGLMASFGTIFEITGALLYYKSSSKINIKKWLYFSVFLGAVTTLSYMYYTEYTAVAYNIVYSFLGMFIFLMVMDFMARSTISGFEATSFAFLCSVSNLALVASNLSGAFLLPVIGLKWLIIISALTSFLCLPLIKRI